MAGTSSMDHANDGFLNIGGEALEVVDHRVGRHRCRWIVDHVSELPVGGKSACIETVLRR